MQINGFMAANPNVGGLEQEVMKYKNDDFCSGVNSDKTDHKSIIVWLFSLYSLYTTLFLSSMTE